MTDTENQPEKPCPDLRLPEGFVSQMIRSASVVLQSYCCNFAPQVDTPSLKSGSKAVLHLGGGS